MRNNVGFTTTTTTTVIMITQLFLPNYATAQSWSSSSSTSSNGVQDERYSNLDPAMAVVMVVLVCTFLLMGFISVYIRQCSEQAAASANSSSYAARIARLGNAPGGGGYCCRRQGLDRAVIDSFPVLAYISVKELKGGKVSGELECAVCLSEFEEFDSLKLLPKCNHVFHPECIDAWLASHVTCPVCRANLEFKLELDSCPRCGIDNSSSSNSGSSSSINNNTNVVTNSIQGESNLQQQQQQHQPQACISVVVSSENRQEEEQEKEERRQILGKLMRSHSTGHSLVIEQVNMERYNLGSPEEGRVSMWDQKECMRRSTSYEVVLDLGTSGSGRNSGSSSGKCANFVRTPPPGGGGCGQGLFMSIKVPISFFGLKVDEEERRRNRPPV